ncbi:substrate-binding domain-containing protein [Microlunatus soli]|uniref:Transcriptional regulator, LacI family n=1 Tax=Microlunatus soli TaxID=630515 RepID=A0A1H1V2T6_9ACTN|nr:substrate-binding domain-containing protein [Microlunatus soli]SDS78696.1 transcriptional regulator, LacI family [Microlunatus soli]
MQTAQQFDPPQRGVTLTAIGSRAGVSKATVSKVLNGRPGVGEDTRRRVQALLDAYGYGGAERAGWLDVVVPSLHDPWSTGVLAELDQHATGEGLSIVLGTAPGVLTDETLTRALGRGSRGLLVVSSRITAAQHSRLVAHRLPFAILDGDVPAVAADRTVDIDYTAGIRQATRHLLDLGHRRIGLVLGPYGLQASERCLDGYHRAFADHGAEPDTGLIRWGEVDERAGEVFAEALLDLADPATAVITVSDVLAIGAYRAITARGLRVGADVSVVGLDDRPEARLMSPPLTTLSIPAGPAAAAALQMLLDPSAGASPPITPELVVRQSSAAVGDRGPSRV